MPTDIYTLPPQQQEKQEENQQDNNQSSNTYSLDAHLNDIDAARQQQLADIDRQQRILNEEFDNYKDPYEALLATKQRTQLIDPRRERARRIISSLYDSLQLIGAFAGMGGFSRGTATPPAPQLASASAKAATAAQQLRQRQQQLDDDLNRSIHDIRQRQATANQQRLRDFKNAALSLDTRRQTINREADRRRDKAIADDNRRKDNYKRMVIQEKNRNYRAAQRAYTAGSGKSTDPEGLITDYYTGNTFALRKEDKNAFLTDMKDLVNYANIDMSGLKGSELTNYAATLSTLLYRDTGHGSDVIERAWDIFYRFFDPENFKKTNQTTTTTASAAANSKNIDKYAQFEKKY